MGLPFTSLDEAVATGPGDAKDLETSLRYHTAYVIIAADDSGAVAVSIEGSADGQAWVGIASASTGIGSPGATFVITSNNHVARYVRANLTTLTGGGSPTVTVKIAST